MSWSLPVSSIQLAVWSVCQSASHSISVYTIVTVSHAFSQSAPTSDIVNQHQSISFVDIVIIIILPLIHSSSQLSLTVITTILIHSPLQFCLIVTTTYTSIQSLSPLPHNRHHHSSLLILPPHCQHHVLTLLPFLPLRPFSLPLF